MKLHPGRGLNQALRLGDERGDRDEADGDDGADGHHEDDANRGGPSQPPSLQKSREGIQRPHERERDHTTITEFSCAPNQKAAMAAAAISSRRPVMRPLAKSGLRAWVGLFIY